MEKLNYNEFKAICKWFHESGSDGIDFEKSFEAFFNEAKKRAINPNSKT